LFLRIAKHVQKHFFNGCRMQDIGCKKQDAGCRIQDTGYRIQDAGCLNNGGFYLYRMVNL
jgi:hypothetical protein